MNLENFLGFNHPLCLVLSNILKKAKLLLPRPRHARLWVHKDQRTSNFWQGVLYAFLILFDTGAGGFFLVNLHARTTVEHHPYNHRVSFRLYPQANHIWPAAISSAAGMSLERMAELNAFARGSESFTHPFNSAQGVKKWWTVLKACAARHSRASATVSGKESMLHGCVNTLIELLSDSDTALESAISWG